MRTNCFSLFSFLHRHYFFLLIIISILTISSAYIGEFFLSQPPCQLCFYQRYVYFSLLGSSLFFILKQNINRIISLLSSFLILFTGFIISFFHSGVERHWFKYNAVCTGFSENISSVEQMIKHIESNLIAECDVLGPKIFGLTMANWNTLLLGSLSFITFYIYCKEKYAQKNC